MRRLISLGLFVAVFCLTGSLNGSLQHVLHADSIYRSTLPTEFSLAMSAPLSAPRMEKYASYAEPQVPERRPKTTIGVLTRRFGEGIDGAVQSVGWQAEQPVFKGGFVSNFDPVLPPTKRQAVGSIKGRTSLPDLDVEIHCLALNIYWEARSEPLLGKIGVAKVTLNRVKHPAFPNSICDVVRQGAVNVLHQCQFSWYCDGRTDVPMNKKAWRQAQGIAYLVALYGAPDPTHGALWYHADYVDPLGHEQ